MGEQADLLLARASCNVQPLWVDVVPTHHGELEVGAHNDAADSAKHNDARADFFF